MSKVNYTTKIEHLEEILDGKIAHGTLSGWTWNWVLEDGKIECRGEKQVIRVGRFKMVNGVIWWSKKGGRKFNRFSHRFESALIEKVVG